MALVTKYFQASAAGGGDGSESTPYNNLLTATGALSGEAEGKLVILPDTIQQWYNAARQWHLMNSAGGTMEIEVREETNKFVPWICSYLDLAMDSSYWEEVDAGPAGWVTASGTNLWRFKVSTYNAANPGAIATNAEMKIVTLFKAGDRDPVNGDGGDPYRDWFAANGPYSSIGRSGLSDQSKDQPGWVTAWNGAGAWGGDDTSRPWRKPSADYQYAAQSNNGTVDETNMLVVYAPSNPASYYSKIRVTQSNGRPLVVRDASVMTINGPLQFYHVQTGFLLESVNVAQDVVCNIDLGDREHTNFLHSQYGMLIASTGNTGATLGGEICGFSSRGCRATVAVNGNTGGSAGDWSTALQLHHLNAQESGNGPESGSGVIYLLSNNELEAFNAPLWIHDIKAFDSSGDLTGSECHGAVYRESSWRGQVRCYNVEADTVPAVLHDNNKLATESIHIWNVKTTNVAKLLNNTCQSIANDTDEQSVIFGFARLDLPSYATWPHLGVNFPTVEDFGESSDPGQEGVFTQYRNNPADTAPANVFDFSASGLQNVEMIGDNTQIGLSGFSEPLLGGIDAGNYANVVLSGMATAIQSNAGTPLSLPGGVATTGAESVDANGYPTAPGTGTDFAAFRDVNGNRRDFRGHPRGSFNRNAYEFLADGPTATAAVVNA